MIVPWHLQMTQFMDIYKVHWVVAYDQLNDVDTGSRVLFHCTLVPLLTSVAALSCELEG